MKLFPFFQIGFSDQSGYGSGAASDDSTQYEGSGSRSGYETKSGFPNWADRCGEGCEGEPVQEVSRSLSPRCKASTNWLDLRAHRQRYVLTSFVAGLWLRWKNLSQLLRAWILLLQKILGHPRSFTGENRNAVIHHRSSLCTFCTKVKRRRNLGTTVTSTRNACRLLSSPGREILEIWLFARDLGANGCFLITPK